MSMGGAYQGLIARLTMLRLLSADPKILQRKYRMMSYLGLVGMVQFMDCYLIYHSGISARIEREVRSELGLGGSDPFDLLAFNNHKALRKKTKNKVDRMQQKKDWTGSVKNMLLAGVAGLLHPGLYPTFLIMLHGYLALQLADTIYVTSTGAEGRITNKINTMQLVSYLSSAAILIMLFRNTQKAIQIANRSTAIVPK